jgi:hypothetical protein
MKVIKTILTVTNTGLNPVTHPIFDTLAPGATITLRWEGSVDELKSISALGGDSGSVHWYYRWSPFWYFILRCVVWGRQCSQMLLRRPILRKS